MDGTTTDLLQLLEESLDALLPTIGQGISNSVAYDTAWLTHLAYRYPDSNFHQATTWLLDHQHADGSWGSSIPHVHDRLISTLSATFALHSAPPTPEIRERINRARQYLNKTAALTQQDNHDTINFQGLATYLTSQLQARGLDISLPRIASNPRQNTKLARLKDRPDLWANHSILHSLECFGPNLANAERFLTYDGSLAASPSATAAILMNSTQTNNRALTYLQIHQHADGGLPNIAPIDLFETNWALYILLQTNTIAPHNPTTKKLVALTKAHWDPRKGQSPSTSLPSKDLDDSSVAATVLTLTGHSVDPSIFATYENENYFWCFHDESDPSLSAHLNLLIALKHLGLEKDHPWIRKTHHFITTYSNPNNFTDKWHVSPYYAIHRAVHALHLIDNNFVTLLINNLLSEQRSDGSWGYYGPATLEETAYALNSLLYYHTRIAPLPIEPIDQAARYILTHFTTEHPSLWIGKALYAPTNVINATILGTLNLYLQVKESL